MMRTWILLMCLILSSCTNTSPISADDDCRKVWVVSGINHTDVMIRMSDLSETFWDRLNPDWIPASAAYVSFGLFNADYIHDGEGGPTLLLPSDAGIWIKFQRDSPELVSPLPEIHPLVMSSHQFDRYVDYLEQEIAVDQQGNAIRVDDGEGYTVTNRIHEHMQIEVQPTRQYSALNYCHTWALSGLREAGLTNMPRLIITSEDLMRFLPRRYPRAQQVCKNYRNDSSDEPTVRPGFIVPR